MADKRSYRLGHRRSDLPGMKNKIRDGLMSEGRWAWVRTVLGQFVILVDTDEDDKADRTIRLYHPIPGRPPVSWNLTALTEEELLKTKELFDAAFEWALPVVQRRDKEAQDAFDNGDDSHARVYRAVPQLVFRKRPESEHSEGIQVGPGRIPDSSRGAINPDEGLRGSGDVLPEPDASGSEAEDDLPSPDLDA